MFFDIFWMDEHILKKFYLLFCWLSTIGSLISSLANFLLFFEYVHLNKFYQIIKQVATNYITHILLRIFITIFTLLIFIFTMMQIFRFQYTLFIRMLVMLLALDFLKNFSKF